MTVLERYRAIALTRQKELPVRMALALFVGLAVTVLTRTAWPAVWFAAWVVTRAMNGRLFRRVRPAEVLETTDQIRHGRYAILRTVFQRRDPRAPSAEDDRANEQQLYTVVLPPGARAIDRTIRQSSSMPRPSSSTKAAVSASGLAPHIARSFTVP